jgi:hypothetical protein
MSKTTDNGLKRAEQTKNGPDISSDKQDTFEAVRNKYSLTVNTVYLYNKGD